ncbi:MAG: helix-turn-helix domain-containing protein, partial [Planctomycetaceae bacterium]|nr:helix-turn-helix domain-containing protein [Planctomycetaceae bacterium]
DLDLDRDSWRDLQAAEAQLQQERDNVSAAIRQAGPHSMLSEMLTDLEQRARELARKRDELESRSRRRPQLPASGAELRSQFAEVSRELAQDSFEFGGLLRSVVPEFHVYLVRLTDGGYFVPRAQIKLSLGAIVRDIERAPDLKEYLTRTFTCDLFEPPTRVRIREEAVRQSAAGIRQRDIADALGTHQATVQRALKLDRKMRERGLTSPYELVLSPPSGESNKKVRRYRHERYRFQPREGYVPPELIE